MVSTGLPSAFFSARFISTSSIDAEFSIFAARLGIAFLITGSDLSSGREDFGASVFAVMSDSAFFEVLDLSCASTHNGASIFAILRALSAFLLYRGCAVFALTFGDVPAAL